MVTANLRILITGNLGYVGPVLVRHLRARYRNAWLVGYDNGYFAHALTAEQTPTHNGFLDRQHIGDVREFPPELFEGVESVVHLAAISNDPMSRRFEAATEDINFRASVAVAEAAARSGVRSYVFASSCSVYGAAAGLAARQESDQVAPLTAYARSKIDTERQLAQMDLHGMTVTCLRFATACGMSDGLRLDLVLNDFVASALTTGRINVLSDGMPWRPLIDVQDMARAMEWGVVRQPENGGPFLSVNVGANNYRIAALAEAVADAIPGTSVRINEDASPDGRSYKVDFSLFQSLAPAFAPQVTLSQSIATLRQGLSSMRLEQGDFRHAEKMRLTVLEKHIADGRLTPDLRWVNRPTGGNHADP
jgi:nucleoside-diphosphate-sugar epimerase